jgi:uncharacterized membrane protein
MDGDGLLSSEPMIDRERSSPAGDLERRLAELERRVARLEGEAPPTPAAKVEAPSAAIEPVPPPPPPPMVSAIPVPARVTPPTAPFHPGPPVLPGPAPRDDAFERFVGGKLAAWVGAIVVIAGLAIFAKFAFDQGWFGRLTPRGKFTLGAAASLVLIFAGELLRGRIGVIPAASLVAAGVGGLYASILAGTALLGVLGPTGSLVASLVALGLGSALTLRSGSLAVGFTSLLGAYISVALSWPFDGREAVVAGSLTLILGAALGLSIAGPAKFRWLRLLELPHATLALMWAFRGPSMETVFGFLALWWAMTVAECSLAALRGRSARLNTSVTLGATSVAVTLAARGVDSGTVLEWLPGVLAALAAAGAWQLGGFSRVADAATDDDAGAARLERTAVRQGQALAFAAAALVTVQAGFALDGPALVFAWAVFGLMGVLAGTRFGQRGIAVAGLATLGLATLVAAVRLLVDSAPAPWVQIAAEGVSAWRVRLPRGWWALAAVPFALLFAARAWTASLSPDRDRVSAVSSVLAGAAALLWTELCLTLLDGYASVAGLLLVPVLATVAGRTPILVKSIGFAWCLLAAVGWFAITLRHGDAAAIARPDGGLLLAGLVTVAFAFLGGRFRREPWGETSFASGLAFGLFALATCLWLDARYGLGKDEPVATALASGATAVASAIAAVTAARAGLGLVARTALVGLSLATITLLTAGSVAGDAAAGMLATRPWLWNGQNLAALAVAASLVAARGSLRGDDRERWADALGGLLLATFATMSSLALWRLLDAVHGPLGGGRGLQEYGQSTWWAILAIGLVALGFRRGRAGLRWTGLVALGLVAAKVLVLDMRNAATIWRVVALLVIGLLLVGTSVLYARAGRVSLRPG